MIAAAIIIGSIAVGLIPAFIFVIILTHMSNKYPYRNEYGRI